MLPRSLAERRSSRAVWWLHALSGTVSYSTTPLTEPAAGQVLLCCTRPDTDVVLDL